MKPKKKPIEYQLIKTKVCSGDRFTYHSDYNNIDPMRSGKDTFIRYRKSYSGFYQYSFKVLNTAFRALADFNKSMKCGCKAEVRMKK